jgi:CRISPR-associated endonuclease/helicase Cas3
MKYYAHSVPGEKTPSDRWQLLREHLAGVAKRAKELADKLGVPGLPAAAETAGWLHDLGKYRPEFQLYIRGLPAMGSKQHKEAGAAWAARIGNNPLTFAILGHHGGMPDPDEAKKAVKGDDGIGVVKEVEVIAVCECAELRSLDISKQNETTTGSELFTRLLLSCLVDADWTDTGEHERQVKGWPEFPAPPALKPNERLDRLLGFIGERAAVTRQKNLNLADIRQRILDTCLTSAEMPTGLFSLTVPTGGGKTLSSLAFALKHAATHGLRRVIYVAPYISILDQNAEVIRQALGVTSDDLAVFEHQSLAEPQGPSLPDEKQSSAAARRSENWDSPIVITTNVQFFESVFSNKPGRCRKLHNIAGSVIVLDECQTLPPDLVKPTCQMLKQITNSLGCTVVLCTATQPAFDHETLKDHRLSATEIIDERQLKLFERLKRVTLSWPTDVNGSKERLPWPEVAKRMKENHSALCIVNTKKAALDLFAELKDQPVFHLSTSMCPAHRLAVLAKVKQRLDAKQPVFVVSTQLIEAGVDIDFPCVFREMAPLESIIQAAGRCNREGLIPNAGGRVVVFRSEEGDTKIPSGWYRKGRDVLETAFLAANRQPSVELPEDIRNYFQHLYWQGELDKVIPSTLPGGTVAEHYRLIADDTVPVVVAGKDGMQNEDWYLAWRDIQLVKNPLADVRSVQERLDALRLKPNRSNFRALAPFQVNVYRHQLEQLKSFYEPLSEEVDLRIWYGKYDPKIGLLPEVPLDDLIV